LLGEQTQSVIYNVRKNLYICYLTQPFVGFKRIIIISPDLAEREAAFEEWVGKIVKIAKELSIPIVHYGDEKTNISIQQTVVKNKLNISINYKQLPEYEDFIHLTNEIHSDDLMVLISSRKGSISYVSDLDILPATLDKYYESNNKIIIYPQQYQYHFLADKYADFTNNPLSLGIEQIENIFK